MIQTSKTTPQHNSAGQIQHQVIKSLTVFKYHLSSTFQLEKYCINKIQVD